MAKLVALGSCFGADRIFGPMVGKISRLSVGYREAATVSQLEKEIEKGDIVLFGGGEDISPSIYKTPIARVSGALATPSTRDAAEINAFKVAQRVGAKCFGICRGAQLLCALSKGKLIQHVNGHGSGHMLLTSDGEKYMTSSVHHQMMWPFEMNEDEYEIIGWSEKRRSDVYIFTDNDMRKSVPLEPEIVYFPKTRSLGVQGHPEFMNEEEPFVKYCKTLFQKYLMDDRA